MPRRAVGYLPHAHLPPSHPARSPNRPRARTATGEEVSVREPPLCSGRGRALLLAAEEAPRLEPPSQVPGQALTPTKTSLTVPHSRAGQGCQCLYHLQEERQVTKIFIQIKFNRHTLDLQVCFMPRSLLLLLQLLTLSHGSESSPEGKQKYLPRRSEGSSAPAAGLSLQAGAAPRWASSCKVYFNQQTPSH